MIEDNPLNLELMVYLFRAFNFTVTTAGDGVEGLALARSAVPDLIICDVDLPRLDGYGVARGLKEDPVLKEIPLVAVTALAMVGDREKLLASGFDGYLSKPILPEIFIRQVNSYLREKGD